MAETIIDNEISSPLIFSQGSDHNIDNMLLLYSNNYIHIDDITRKILGTYNAINSKIAAEKAFTTLLKIKMENNDILTSQKIYLMDNNTKKNHVFLVHRVKRTKTLDIDIDNKKIVFHYKNLVERLE